MAFSSLPFASPRILMPSHTRHVCCYLVCLLTACFIKSPYVTGTSMPASAICAAVRAIRSVISALV
jgi:hypothetical protein